jgi:DNA-binding response OmpR family regulator
MSPSSAVEQVLRESIPNARARVDGAVTQVAQLPPLAPLRDARDRSGATTRVGPILVVESDRDRGRILAEQLLADGYGVQLARTAEHARVLADATAPRLAVLGTLDGPRGALQLLEEIRQADRLQAPWDVSLPTIVIGAQARELDMLRAFEGGADDFLARPARYLELRARLRAILRRTERVAGPERLLEVGPLCIDPSAREVRLHSRAVRLRRLEFELLLHLAGDPTRVFPRDELLRVVWGYRSIGSTRTVDSHASRLRRKLDVDGSRRWVVNVRGVGYRLL